MKANLCQKILGALKFDYLKEDDSELGRVAFGVLTVAMMVAALDGVIQPVELAEFSKLAKKCRVSDGERAAYYESALHSAGYILLMSRSGLSEKALVAAFAKETAKVLPTGFAGGRPEDIRRALVIWVTMGASDGDFCGIERKCVDAVRAQAAEALRGRCAGKEKLWLNLKPTFRAAASGRKPAGTATNDVAFGEDLLARVERLVAIGDTAAIRKFIING